MDDIAAVADKPGRSTSVRRAVAFTLVILTAVAVLAASLATWAKRTVLETDRFTAVAEQLVADERVTDALVDSLAPTVMFLIDDVVPQREDLPGKVAVLRPLLIRSLDNVVRTQLRELLSSERGQAFVVGAVRRAHAATMKLLDSRGLFDSALKVESGQITLDLLPLVERVLVKLEQSGIIPSAIPLPEPGSGDGLAVLEAAFDKDLPADFGKVVLYEGDKVTNAQESFGQLQSALALFRKGVVALWITAALLMAGALGVSVRRRRTLFQLGVAIAASMVVFRVLLNRAAEVLPEVATSPESRDVAAALVEAATSGLKRFAAILILAGIVVAIAGYIAGRAEAAATRGELDGPVELVESGGGVLGWIRRNPELARVAVLVSALLLLYVWGLSWFSMVFTVGLAGIAAAGVAALAAGPARAPSTT